MKSVDSTKSRLWIWWMNDVRRTSTAEKKERTFLSYIRIDSFSVFDIVLRKDLNINGQFYLCNMYLRVIFLLFDSLVCVRRSFEQTDHYCIACLYNVFVFPRYDIITLVMLFFFSLSLSSFLSFIIFCVARPTIFYAIYAFIRSFSYHFSPFIELVLRVFPLSFGDRVLVIVGCVCAGSYGWFILYFIRIGNRLP